MKNLLLGAKIFFIAVMAMAFVACDKDDNDNEPETYVDYGTMVVTDNGGVSSFTPSVLENPIINFTTSSEVTLTINDIKFVDGMPAPLDYFKLTGITGSDGIYSATSPTVSATMYGADASYAASVSDLTINVFNDTLYVEFDVTVLSRYNCHVVYIGDNRQLQ
ncbi:MAG: hypothetical protein SNG35_05305 [Rikenellaceae bacterium]